MERVTILEASLERVKTITSSERLWRAMLKVCLFTIKYVAGSPGQPAEYPAREAVHHIIG